MFLRSIVDISGLCLRAGDRFVCLVSQVWHNVEFALSRVGDTQGWHYLRLAQIRPVCSGPIPKYEQEKEALTELYQELCKEYEAADLRVTSLEEECDRKCMTQQSRSQCATQYAELAEKIARCKEEMEALDEIRSRKLAVQMCLELCVQQCQTLELSLGLY